MTDDFVRKWQHKSTDLIYATLPWERSRLPKFPPDPNPENVRLYVERVKPFLRRGRWWFALMTPFRTLFLLWRRPMGKFGVCCLLAVFGGIGIHLLHLGDAREFKEETGRYPSLPWVGTLELKIDEIHPSASTVDIPPGTLVLRCGGGCFKTCDDLYYTSQSYQSREDGGGRWVYSGASGKSGNFIDHGLTVGRPTIVMPFVVEAMTTEVTQGLYKEVMGRNHSSFSSPDKADDVRARSECGEYCPVYGIEWKDAVEFLNVLSVQTGFQPCYLVGESNVTWHKDCDGWRLPTEGEWEYMAWGLTNEDESKEGYQGHAGSFPASDYAWFEKNSGFSVHPVAQKKGNSFGMFDMSGNVPELVWTEAYDRYWWKNEVPNSFSTEQDLVVKGGGYNGDHQDICIAGQKSSSVGGNGFRGVRTALPNRP